MMTNHTSRRNSSTCLQEKVVQNKISQFGIRYLFFIKVRYFKILNELMFTALAQTSARLILLSSTI